MFWTPHCTLQIRHMERFWKWLKQELREILPVWAFFLLSFGLMAFTASTFLGGYHVKLSEPPAYIGGSLIMAKAVIVIDAFLKREWLRNRPLVYAVFLNAILYFAGGLTLRHAERMFELMWRQHMPLAQANAQVLSEMGQPQYWAVIVWVMVVILGFSLTHEVVRIIGRDRFVQLLFKRNVPPTGETLRKVS